MDAKRKSRHTPNKMRDDGPAPDDGLAPPQTPPPPWRYGNWDVAVAQTASDQEDETKASITTNGSNVTCSATVSGGLPQGLAHVKSIMDSQHASHAFLGVVDPENISFSIGSVKLSAEEIKLMDADFKSWREITSQVWSSSSPHWCFKFNQLVPPRNQCSELICLLMIRTRFHCSYTSLRSLMLGSVG